MLKYQFELFDGHIVKIIDDLQPIPQSEFPYICVVRFGKNSSGTDFLTAKNSCLSQVEETLHSLRKLIPIPQLLIRKMMDLRGKIKDIQEKDLELLDAGCNHEIKI